MFLPYKKEVKCACKFFRQYSKKKKSEFSVASVGAHLYSLNKVKCIAFPVIFLKVSTSEGIIAELIPPLHRTHTPPCGRLADRNPQRETATPKMGSKLFRKFFIKSLHFLLGRPYVNTNSLKSFKGCLPNPPQIGATRHELPQ